MGSGLGRIGRWLPAVGVCVLGLAAVFAPWLATHDPYALSLAPLTPPGATHWLGTDDLGRDVLSRLLYGARISLGVAVVAVATALVAGTLLGLWAGQGGRWADAAVGRTTEVMFALPDLLLALVLMAVLPRGPWTVALAIAIVYTPMFARVCRAAVLEVRSAPYVEAARALGAVPLHVTARHVLPNIRTALMTQAALSLAFAVLAEAALSFLGLSGEPDVPSWGRMLRRGRDWMDEAWWLAVFPGAALTLAVLAFNTVASGSKRQAPRV